MSSEDQQRAKKLHVEYRKNAEQASTDARQNPDQREWFKGVQHAWNKAAERLHEEFALPVDPSG